jgi:hypothetical protein
LRIIMTAPPYASDVRLREPTIAWTGLSANGGQAPANDRRGPAARKTVKVNDAKGVLGSVSVGDVSV